MADLLVNSIANAAGTGPTQFPLGSTVIKNVRAAEGAGTTTLSATDNRWQVFALSGSRTVLLPTTGILKGESVTLQNTTTQSITVRSSDNTTITPSNYGTGSVGDPSLNKIGTVMLTCNQDTPTAPGHWVVSFVSPGAVSSIVLDTPVGFGSGNTKVVYFTNITTVGNDLTGANSSTNGATITVNSSGLYEIHAVVRSSSNNDFGITVNSTAAPSTLAFGTTSLAMGGNVAGDYVNVSAMKFLAAADVIRVSGDGAGTLSSNANSGVMVVKL